MNASVGSKILIGGGTGFLGKRLKLRLDDLGYRSVVVSRSSGVDFRNRYETVKAVSEISPDIVVNCAVNSGGIKVLRDHAGEVIYDNLLISSHLIEASRLSNTGRYINIISNCSYPEVSEKKLIEEEWWDGPMHPSVVNLGAAKKASWAMTSAYNSQYGMNFINLIFPNMFGPDDHFDEVKSHALGALIMKMVKAKNESIPSVNIWGSGNQVREWLFVEDAVEAIVRSFGISPRVDPINIGVGAGVSIKDLAYLIREAVGYKGELVFDTSKPDGSAYRVMDVTKCQRIFGWLPTTTLVDGIDQTVTWYRNQNP